MSDTTRVVLIAVGVALLVSVVVPVLFLGGMMGTMMGGGMMPSGSMMGGGGMIGAGPWVMLGLAIVVLVAGGALLTVGLRR
jgi:hypothetical protein